MYFLTFDIETIPDVDAGRRLHELPDDLSDAEVGEIMFAKRREVDGRGFLPHYLQRVAAISVALSSDNSFKIWTLGTEDSTEGQLIEQFFAGLDKFRPSLVSWNGSGFDLPVLQMRSLVHGIAAPTYWETGDSDPQFRWNNYLSRYHQRHLDLMDVLASYQSRAYAPLDALATTLGLPGKQGLSGAGVWDQFQAGDIQSIRDYCETDVLNTYLVFLRFQKIRGKLSADAYQNGQEQVLEWLKEKSEPHWVQFLEGWSRTASP